MRFVLLLITLAAVVSCSAVPNHAGDKKSHVVDQKLSDLEHLDEEGHHNTEYDHEAFLGKDDAQKFDNLAPEESKRRLGWVLL